LEHSGETQRGGTRELASRGQDISDWASFAVFAPLG
jgi:hypothetical protein